MPRYITLKLVNEQGTPHAWPGTDTQFEIGSQESVVPVWIGVNADGSDNQIFPITADAQVILQSWAHLYQGIQINQLIPGDDSPSEVGPGEFVYYVSLEEFNRLVAACCIATRIDESPQESPSPELPFDIMMLMNFPDALGVLAFWTTFFSPSQFFVDWGDGSAVEEFNSDNVTPEHEYAEAGEYTVRITFTTPTDLASFELVNTPQLQSIAFREGLESVPGTINLQNNALSDGDVDFANMPPAIALILANNNFTPAVLALIKDAYTTLNLSDNNLNGVDLADLPTSIGNLYMNNCSLGVIDLTGLAVLDFPPTELQFSNNGLTEFAAGDFDDSNLSSLLLGDNALDAFPIGDMTLANLLILDLQGNSLDSAGVDSILEALDVEGLTGGQVNTVNQTPSAPPGIGGTVAQGSLESKGWTVTVDV